MSKFADQVADLMAAGDNIVTKHMHGWDGVMTRDAIERVAFQEIQDNSDAGREGRRSGAGRIRPSNLHETCPRFHMLSYLDFPKNERDKSLMNDGTQRHYYWQKVGLSAGFLTDIEVKVKIPYLEIAGSMDGNMIDDSVFEFKGTGPTLYNRIMKTRKPAYDHVLQVTAYMKARGVKKSSIVYEKRAWQTEWHEFRVDYSEEVFEDLISRVAPVLSAMAIGELPPMLDECLGLSGKKFHNCDYNAVCPSAEFDE